ncbi:glycine cleavage system T protein [Xylaria arbuscula]|nr:glycine cleavage system T protein [Xylaria arbuscula]
MKFPRVVSAAGKGARALGSSRNANCTPVRAFASSATVNTSPIATTKPQPARPNYPQPRRQQRIFTPHNQKAYASSSSAAPLGRTALYDLHLAHGAKMVPFGGFEMPVQYSGLGVSASHHFTREKASLFDVGHMVQHRFEGPGATAFLQRITPGSLEALPAHQSTLSALLWPGTGGIVDDTVITRLEPELFYVVTNAACREKDLAYLKEQLTAWDGAEVRHETLDGWGLIALQGPLAEELLTQILEDPTETNLRELYFGQSRFAKVKGAANPVLVSRAGYTGEDGFEISISPADTVSVTETLLATSGPEKLQFAGLGARDSLRLEAGMCLYGHDLDDTTTPVEGALGWIVGKDRRSPATDAAKFHGADVILAQLLPKSKGGSGVTRRRVGLTIEGAPAREGAEIVSADGNNEKIGVVTSGCPSPTLGKNIAMGYVKDGLHKAGTEVQVLVRGRTRKAVVTKMPFVPAKYWKGTAPA